LPLRNVTARLRHRFDPIIILTALSGEMTTGGLDCGASDYLTKPFSPKAVKRVEHWLREVAPDLTELHSVRFLCLAPALAPLPSTFLEQEQRSEIQRHTVTPP
jgi:DNA-binding response OmpR family regulator